MVQVKVKQGILEGGTKQSVLDGKEYFHFSGIPYGEPPVGHLRFRPPVPAKSWEGVRAAVEEGTPCYQKHFFEDTVFGDEDCLYLNVYTPELPRPETSLKAVMVYIHGGGFMCGSGSADLAGPDFLIRQNVILVTFNYRLHILGFLNLNVPNCSGNFGLKDQCLALKWIKDNIQSFGGDPNNITVFGESAGAASVHLQTISPLNKGVIKKAILQSGSALAPWAIIHNPEKYAFETGKKLGYSGHDPHELAEFLREQPVETLYSVAKIVTDEKKLACLHDCQGLAFSPSVETIKENAFLPDLPLNLLKTAEPMPMISGVDEVEGVIILFFSQGKLSAEEIVKNLEPTIQVNVPFCEPNKVPELAMKVKEFYFDEETDSNEDRGKKMRNFLNFFSDLFFLNLYNSVDYVISSPHPVYFYQFSFEGKFNQSVKWPFPTKGANHADELPYIFHAPSMITYSDFSGSERKIIDYFTTLWANFAKTSNPTPDPTQFGVQWKPHTEENPVHLNIDSNLKCVDGRIWNTRRNFWMDAAKKFSRLVKK